jgi:hypothetical protein
LNSYVVNLSCDQTQIWLICKRRHLGFSRSLSNPCYLKCGPGTSSIGITWELVRSAHSQATPHQAQHVGNVASCFCELYPMISISMSQRL